jgi:hypothetical protein
VVWAEEGLGLIVKDPALALNRALSVFDVTRISDPEKEAMITASMSTHVGRWLHHWIQLVCCYPTHPEVDPLV